VKAASAFGPSAAGGTSPVVLPSIPETAPPPVPAIVPAAAAQVGPGAPAAARLNELRRTAQASPAGMLAASLVSTHFDEVLRLVNTRRRVTVAWHRMGGPDLLALVLATPAGEPVAIPAMIGDRSVAEGLALLLDALEREGSLPLRSDVAKHRDLILSLPGMDLSDLERLDVAG
jgi:hypothetical protein